VTNKRFVALPDPSVMWHQTQISLPTFPRGFHLITDHIVSALPQLAEVSPGLLHIFIQHTSASLTINENADPDVRRDMETAVNHLCPESMPFVHTCEGPDDMPAHVKASLFGCGLTIPVGNGRLLLGTWQGIYLCEHRNRGGARRLVLTLQGK
jgi:secondary thiamine-phosphate synthase enzyme